MAAIPAESERRSVQTDRPDEKRPAPDSHGRRIRCSAAVLRFAALTPARIARFWFPRPITPSWTAFGIDLATLLSIPGIALMFRRRVPFAWAVVFAYAVFPLMYYVVVTGISERIEILRWSRS
jgi:hypothetical protein